MDFTDFLLQFLMSFNVVYSIMTLCFESTQISQKCIWMSCTSCRVVRFFLHTMKWIKKNTSHPMICGSIMYECLHYSINVCLKLSDKLNLFNRLISKIFRTTIKHNISVFGVLCGRYCVLVQYAKPGNHLAYWIAVHFCFCECSVLLVCDSLPLSLSIPLSLSVSVFFSLNLCVRIWSFSTKCLYIANRNNLSHELCMYLCANQYPDGIFPKQNRFQWNHGLLFSQQNAYIENRTFSPTVKWTHKL